MSHKLERYLATQRKNLDVESPDDNVIWNGIKGRLQTKEASKDNRAIKIRLIRIRKIAATVIILFSLGYITSDIINRNKNTVNLTLSSIDNDLGLREKEYRAKVSFKTDEVKLFTGSEDKVIRELFAEIDKLDIIYKQSMADFKDLGPNEKVIHTIFDTYEQKIRLLELIILETNKIESHENDEKIIL